MTITSEEILIRKKVEFREKKMAKESTFTSAERASLKICQFIFHIIIEDEDEPIFLEEVRLTSQQKDFFRERIADVSTGTQYIFLDEQDSNFFNNCQDLLSNPEERFIPVSRRLALDFHSRHKGNASDGVFIVAIVEIETNGEVAKLISLIKMDHTRVLQYKTEDTEEGKRAIIEEIPRSFVEDKAAMQKVALVDASDVFAWDLLAVDRTKPSGGIAEYFRSFLSATERENDSVLTRKAVSEVRQWAQLQESLPPDEDVSTYKHRAILYMETHDQFETDEFVRMVVCDQNEDRKAEMSQSLHDHLAEAGVAGQGFSPKPQSLPKSLRKNKRETLEGIRIEWEGAAIDKGLRIPPEPDDNGVYDIRIRTSKVTELQ